MTSNKGNKVLLVIKHRYRRVSNNSVDIRGLQFLLKLPRDLQVLTANSQQPSALPHYIT